MKRPAWKWLAPVCVFLMTLTGLAVIDVTARVQAGRYVRYAEVRAVLDEMNADLPIELKALPQVGPEAPWSAWIVRHDTEIRARLARGDEDTIVNWLLLGGTFTSQPRVDLAELPDAEQQAVQRLAELIGARIDDFVRALESPRTDERRLFARHFFEMNGFSFATPAAVDDLRRHLLAAISRVAEERGELGRELDTAVQSGDADAVFALRARLFSDRGLSLDTSLPANFGIEQSLAAMKTRGLVAPSSIRRVAIIGAGLDFADKDAGFDFYPQQTVQPFAMLDSLRKLHLMAAAGADIMIFDISPRIIDHVTRARTRAASGTPYTLTLPLAKAKEWLPDFHDYWQHFGSAIGTSVPSRPNAAVAAQAELRVVRLPPAVVERVSIADLDIVAQRFDDPQFDLIVATNVLLYYDAVDQALAFANVESMLRPGGVFLSNTALPMIKALPMSLADSHTTMYDQAGEGDHIIAYQRTK